MEFKTNNFQRIKPWLKRVFFTTAFFALLLNRLVDLSPITTTGWLIIVAIYVIIIAANQVDELTVTNSEIIVEQRSIIPLLCSKRRVSYSNITSVKRNSNFVMNDGHWFVFLNRKRKLLEINLADGSYEVINSNLHPHGLDGLYEVIETNRAKQEQQNHDLA